MDADRETYEDDALRSLLRGVRTVAMVGASPKWIRPSYFVMKYLQLRGFTVHPVNPAAAGQTILGARVYSTLAEVPGRFEMVDVFRHSEAAEAVVDEALELKDQKGIRVIWMQLGVYHRAAAARARAAGLEVVMDRCPKIEWSRLHGELAWAGLDTGIIDSRRPRR